jgi:hypothetical protein
MHRWGSGSRDQGWFVPPVFIFEKFVDRTKSYCTCLLFLLQRLLFLFPFFFSFRLDVGQIRGRVVVQPGCGACGLWVVGLHVGRLWVVGCGLSVVGCRLSVVGCRTVPCRLSAAGLSIVGSRRSILFSIPVLFLLCFLFRPSFCFVGREYRQRKNNYKWTLTRGSIRACPTPYPPGKTRGGTKTHPGDCGGLSSVHCAYPPRP